MSQYEVECMNNCGKVLAIDVAIMCYDDGEKELTLCSNCYWDAGYYKTDKNEDNEDEIQDYIEYQKSQKKIEI